MMNKFITAMAAVFLMSGCALIGNGSWSQEKSIVSACQAFGQSLTILSQYNSAGKLSSSQEATVDDVVAVVGPICSQDELPTQERTVRLVVNNVATLNTIEANVKEDSNGSQ